MAAFRYASLKSSRSIRLLVLQPSLRRNAPVSCYLRDVDLSALPRYEALSYTWGDQTPCIPLQCGNSQLLIAENVDAAINQLRRRLFHRTIWIDAICIDQHSMKERGNQVALMDQIFRNARRVLIWLGPGDKNTSRAIREMKLVFPIWRFFLNFPFMRYRALRGFQRLKEKLQYILTEDHDAASSGKPAPTVRVPSDSESRLRGIVNHDWFRRIWTIQEISLSKRGRIVVGGSTVSWESLSNTLTFDGILSSPSMSIPVLREGGYNPATPIYNGSPFMYRVQQIQIFRESVRSINPRRAWLSLTAPVRILPTMPFIYNLLLTSLNPDYLVTDPRDRVFGLHGLLHACGVALPPPDYSQSLPDIVLESIKAISINYNCLEFLERVTGESSFQQLPSWIPEFSAVPWASPRLDSSLRLEDRYTPEFKFNKTELVVSGSLVAHIKSISDSFSHENTSGKHPFSALNMSSDLFLRKLSDWIQFVRNTTPEADEESERRLLFQLFLHPQILPFYESLGFQVYDRRMSNPADRYSGHRLFEHFCAWLDAVAARNPAVTCASDHVFDQVQHFVSSEWINTSTDYVGEARTAHTIGYQRAMLVVQRWVREFAARKRLFATDAGRVGIGWQAVRRGDLVARVDGVGSPMVLREVDGGERFRVVGPCLIPRLGRPSGGERRRRFVLV